MKLTERQKGVLISLYYQKVGRSGNDGSILRALEKKKLTAGNPFAQGQNIYYTWTLTDAARGIIFDLIRERTERQAELWEANRSL